MKVQNHESVCNHVNFQFVSSSISMSSPSHIVLVFVFLVLSLLPYTVPCMYPALGCVYIKAYECSDWLCLYHMLQFVGGVTVCLIIACHIRQFQRRKWPKVRKPVSKSLWVWIIILLFVHRIQCHQATILSDSPISRFLSLFFISLECIQFCLACMIQHSFIYTFFLFSITREDSHH